ncbi:hypothetical protein TNCV_2798941 [Trichonephila clavipes]|nr:hypothetical protein TNCV_2798941 [Trichonephila clavipes]
MSDSSVRTTSFHSTAHILLSSHHWWRRRLWFCIKGRPSNVRHVDRPLCCKRRRKVCTGPEKCVTYSMCYAAVRDMTKQSITDMRTICLSSCEVLH